MGWTAMGKETLDTKKQLVCYFFTNFHHAFHGIPSVL